MSKTPERLAYEAWYRKQFDSTMYCESTWRGWEAGRAALTQAADAGAAEPVAWANMAPEEGEVYSVSLQRDEYHNAALVLKSEAAQQAVARAESAVLALMRTGNPTTDLFVAGFNVAIGCAVDAIRQQGKP